MSASGFYDLGGVRGISSHIGAFTVALSAKGKKISAKQMYMYQMRGFMPNWTSF